MKRKIAIILVFLIIIGGWTVSLLGVGESFKPMKDRMKLGLDLKGGVYVIMEAETDKTGAELKKAMSQAQAIIEKRVNMMGLSEPIVSIEGENRIRVELPGAEDADDAINQIGKTAMLQFALADGTVMLDGSMVKDAGVQIGEKGGFEVSLSFNQEGATAFAEATGRAASGQVVPIQEGLDSKALLILLDGEIISAPSTREVISGGQAAISGKFTREEATNLSVLIRGGALPDPLSVVQTSIVGPTLGLEALQKSIFAGVLGIGIVMLIMIFLYRGMGMIANIALFLFILVDLWLINAFGTVLTLMGIAGIILSIGMAVDANIIIFSRIQEEIRKGKSVRVANEAGFKRAMATIVDSNITTLIAAVVLYVFGTGMVKGFAVTLSIGIIISMFTAVVITKLLLTAFAESKTFGTKKWFAIKDKGGELDV